jgi:hypothetical protein
MVQGHVTEGDISLNHPKVYRQQDKTGRQEKQHTTTNPPPENVSRYYRLILNTPWILRLLDIYF